MKFLKEWLQKYALLEEYPGYTICLDGTVWSSRRSNFLKAHPNRGGYLRVNLITREGKRKSIFLHKLVLLAFRGPAPSAKHHGAHLDGNKNNNAADNLEWKLPAENEADKKLHGTHAGGGRKWRPNKERIQRILERHAQGASFTTIGEEEGMHRSSISRIIRGLRRKKLTQTLQSSK